jgi:hypothetical protein
MVNVDGTGKAQGEAFAVALYFLEVISSVFDNVRCEDIKAGDLDHLLTWPA